MFLFKEINTSNDYNINMSQPVSNVNENTKSGVSNKPVDSTKQTPVSSKTSSKQAAVTTTPGVTTPVVETPVVTTAVATSPVATEKNTPVQSTPETTTPVATTTTPAPKKKAKAPATAADKPVTTKTEQTEGDGVATVKKPKEPKKQTVTKNVTAKASNVDSKSETTTKRASKVKQSGGGDKPAKVLKTAVVKKPRVSKKSVQQTEDSTTAEQDSDKKCRSFKVKLPNKEEYEGRFTGLTPYQAANKALSKYFRELKNTDENEITFSICESTRNSNKNEYTYIGKRYVLTDPVTYKIKDKESGEEKLIVKKYKNILKKVKKVDTKVNTKVDTVETPAVAPVETLPATATV